jgi:hypothetical protein
MRARVCFAFDMSAAAAVHAHFAVEMEQDADGRCVSWNDADFKHVRMYFAENDSFQTYSISKMSGTEVTSPHKETAIPRKTILDSAFNKRNNTACFLVTKPEDVDSDDSNSDRDDDTPIPYVLFQYDKKNKVASKKELFRITYAESLLAIHDNGDILVYSEPEEGRPFVQVFDGTTFVLKNKWPCFVRDAYRMYAVPGDDSTAVLLASPKGLYCQDLVTNTHLHMRRQKHIEDFTVLPDGRVVVGIDDNRIQVISKDLNTVQREWTSELTVDTSLNPAAIDMEPESGSSDDSDAESLFVDDEDGTGADDSNSDSDYEATDDSGDDKEEDKKDDIEDDNDSSDVSTSVDASADDDEEPDVFKQIRDIFSSKQYVFVRFVSDDVLVYKISSF